MQRTASGRMDPQTPIAGKTPAGKTIPGKGLTIEQLQHAALSSRPSTPNALGWNIGSPGLMGHSPAMSGVSGGMNLNILAGLESPALAAIASIASGMEDSKNQSNMSSLGLGPTLSGTMASARMDENDRRRRIGSILGTIGTRPGRISRVAVERLARRFEMVIHDGGDPFVMAGKNAVLIEVSSRLRDCVRYL